MSAMPEVAAQLEQGGRNRAVGAHDMNEHSSRSHMIFNVRGESKRERTTGRDMATRAPLRPSLCFLGCWKALMSRSD